MHGTQKTVTIDRKQDWAEHTALIDTITNRELSRVSTIPVNTDQLTAIPVQQEACNWNWDTSH